MGKEKKKKKKIIMSEVRRRGSLSGIQDDYHLQSDPTEGDDQPLIDKDPYLQQEPELYAHLFFFFFTFTSASQTRFPPCVVTISLQRLLRVQAVPHAPQDRGGVPAAPRERTTSEEPPQEGGQREDGHARVGQRDGDAHEAGRRPCIDGSTSLVRRSNRAWPHVQQTVEEEEEAKKKKMEVKRSGRLVMGYII